MNHSHKFTVNPHNVTGCWRGVYYEKNGYPKPQHDPELLKKREFFMSFVEEGRRVENAIRETWKKEERLIQGETFLPKNALGLTGRFDALYRSADDTPVLVEIKRWSTTFENYIKNGIPWELHRKQLAMYYLVLRPQFEELKAGVLYGNIHDGITKWTDPKLTDDYLEQVLSEVNELHDHLDNDRMPEPIKTITISEYNGRPDVNVGAIFCSYHELCTGDEHWYVNALNEIGDD